MVPALELAFHIRLDFEDGPRTRFTPAGTQFTRGFVGLAGGEITGPRLTGRVVPHSGGDWPRIWDSGLVEFEAHYMLEAADGTPIYIHNRGIAWSSPDALARIEAGETLGPADNYVRVTPRFEAPAGPHDWLNRTIFVGAAERRGNSTFFDYYAVTRLAGTLSAADRLELHDLVARYCWALDTGDVEGLVACFCRDGVLAWDAFDVPLRWQGAEALRHFATFLRDQPSTAGRQHHVTNLVIEPDETGARGKAFVAVALRQGDGPHLLNVMGWYDDRYRREDGHWKIAERTIRDWSGPVLAGIAGQTGDRVARPLPPPLAGLVYRPSEG